jgi:hypothetical protein
MAFDWPLGEHFPPSLLGHLYFLVQSFAALDMCRPVYRDVLFVLYHRVSIFRFLRMLLCGSFLDNLDSSRSKPL